MVTPLKLTKPILKRKHENIYDIDPITDDEDEQGKTLMHNTT